MSDGELNDYGEANKIIHMILDTLDEPSKSIIFFKLMNEDTSRFMNFLYWCDKNNLSVG